MLTLIAQLIAGFYVGLVLGLSAALVFAACFGAEKKPAAPAPVATRLAGHLWNPCWN